MMDPIELLYSAGFVANMVAGGGVIGGLSSDTKDGIRVYQHAFNIYPDEAGFQITLPFRGQISLHAHASTLGQAVAIVTMYYEMWRPR